MPSFFMEMARIRDLSADGGPPVTWRQVAGARSDLWISDRSILVPRRDLKLPPGRDVLVDVIASPTTPLRSVGRVRVYMSAPLGRHGKYRRLNAPDDHSTVHRIRYTAFNGPIPPHLSVRHVCEKVSALPTGVLMNDLTNLTLGTAQDQGDDARRQRLHAHENNGGHHLTESSAGAMLLVAKIIGSPRQLAGLGYSRAALDKIDRAARPSWPYLDRQAIAKIASWMRANYDIRRKKSGAKH